MAEIPKLLYVSVVDNGDSFRYTRSLLQSTLQLMGCKARHAFKISRRVFDTVRSECSRDEMTVIGDGTLVSDAMKTQTDSGSSELFHHSSQHKLELNSSIPFELYKRLTTVIVSRNIFLNIVCDALSSYKYVGPNQRADLILACRIRERKESVTILLCGTSGCGKSTLSSLLGTRLGITTVVSTDSIRHMMRGFVDEKRNPLLWASTYHAGECLDPVAVAEAKAKKKARKQPGIYYSKLEGLSESGLGKNIDIHSADARPRNDLISKKQMAVEGYKAQSEMVTESLDRLITAWEDRKESVIVEGVHLSINFVMGLMKKHPSIIPFMIYIANENKHTERFAVRAKYMTLDPTKNRYVKYIRNIRTIQDYLSHRADKHLVPKINNTNVDRSVATIHATVFSCLRRRDAGEHLLEPATKTVPIIYEEYRNQCNANSMSSKGMFQLIQSNGSSRRLMALINTDGSVAKAWPVGSFGDDHKPPRVIWSERRVGSPVFGPLQIETSEPVNLQFGNFGISAWPSETGGTSRAGSIDDSWVDSMESRYFSSCCSSPKMSEGHTKEPMEESLASGGGESDGSDDLSAVDSDENLSDEGEQSDHEDMEGSVDEEATNVDDEYDDLAIRDGLDSGYCSDNDEPAGAKIRKLELPGQNNCGMKVDDILEKYLRNMHLSLQ